MLVGLLLQSGETSHNKRRSRSPSMAQFACFPRFGNATRTPPPPLALTQLAKGQGTCLAELRTLATRADVSVTEVPYFDVEVRATYGLRALGAALFDEPPGK